nr:MATE family efflux transporter [Salmonella enterica]
MLYHVKTTKSHYIAILRRSSGFFLFTLLSIVVLQTDYMVISQRLTPADIVQYTVTMKIFGLVFFIYTAILQALWPICAELRVKQQWKKLNKMIGVNILLGSLYVVGCTILCNVIAKYELFKNTLDISTTTSNNWWNSTMVFF